MPEFDCTSLTIGFLVNPLAGAGGPAGHKGSDLAQTKELLSQGEIDARSPGRAQQFLSALESNTQCDFLVAPKYMGADYFSEAQQSSIQVLSFDLPESTNATTSQDIVREMLSNNIDMLVFVGGDGTARDVCSVVNTSVPVLGVPSGVKMHSGVFAITPDAAAKVLAEIANGQLVSLSEQDVRDIDEEALQHAQVKSRYFGSMLVPEEIRYMQSVKAGGIEVDELVLQDIAAEIEERIDEEDQENTLYIFATGSTTHFIEESLACEASLLGVDVIKNRKVQALDVSAKELETIVEAHHGKVVIVLTAIGGQGHILGRGNQQLSPKVLKRVGRDNLWLVITKTKLETLDARPLLIDSNDPELDKAWQGLIPVITGYHDQVLYRLACDAGDD
ncbi:MAG: ATP-NAD kinase family protein [Agarilytica sp.]